MFELVVYRNAYEKNMQFPPALCGEALCSFWEEEGDPKD